MAIQMREEAPAPAADPGRDYSRLATLTVHARGAPNDNRRPYIQPLSAFLDELPANWRGTHPPGMYNFQRLMDRLTATLGYNANMHELQFLFGHTIPVLVGTQSEFMAFLEDIATATTASALRNIYIQILPSVPRPSASWPLRTMDRVAGLDPRTYPGVSNIFDRPASVAPIGGLIDRPLWLNKEGPVTHWVSGDSHRRPEEIRDAWREHPYFGSSETHAVITRSQLNEILREAGQSAEDSGDEEDGEIVLAFVPPRDGRNRRLNQPMTRFDKSWGMNHATGITMLPGFSRATPVTPLNPAGAHENPVAAPEQHSRIPVAVNPDPQGVEGYQVEEAEDEDFGRLDFRIVDANVRSYNDGDNNSDWLALLDFFHLDAEEVRRRTEINRGNGSTRVPFGRIPGMTVGLFDYQLMGVYKLLGFLLTGVSGGFLADEQGLGKTQEMFGVLVLTYNLRKCKEEVEEVWAARQAHRQVHARSAMHNQRGAEARTCPYDTRFGFRCYCYHPMTRQLADALPDGPSVIIAPTQNCMPIIRDARTKLDQRPLKLRGFGDHIDRDFRLTPAEIQSLRGEVRIQLGEQGVTGARIQQYTACANRSDFIIVTSPDSIDALNQAFTNTVPGTIMRRSSFIPGVVMLDEFHQYAIEESRVLCWLNHVKSSLLNSERPQPMPLVYFVSGTPIDQSPADIRPAYIVLERRNVWSDSQHALNHATLANFDFMTNLFDTYIEQQRRGEEVSEDKVKDFYASLDGIFGSMMVRRLGTNTFRDQPLTNVGRLRVAIIDHRLPSAVADNLVGHGQALSDIFDGPQPRPWVPLSQRLRGPQGPSLLLKLRIASTFPGIPVSNQPFRFTDDEVRRYLTEASGRVERTPYFAHIAAWAAHSPKLETISHTITTMLADNSRIPGEATTRKKYIIFCPVEAEALLMACWLHHRRTQERLGIRVAYIHSSMTPADRQRAITSFLTMGNAPPNILVTPISVGGTGLNLQRAKYSTVTGPAWTKRETQQAFYRIHRVGQVQPTRLQLLAARWNPAERVILSKYEGRDAVAITEENNATEAVNEWFEVSNRFCETPVYNPGRVIDQHQDQNTY